MFTDEIKFLRKGRFIDLAAAKKHPITVAGLALAEDGLAMVFDSDKEFHRWIDESIYGETVHRIEAAVAALRERRQEFDSSPPERLKAKLARVGQDLDEVAALHRLSREDAGYEIFLKASVERDPFDPPVFDPTLLFDLAGLKGGWLPLLTLVPMPDLRWFSWNDRASSLAVYGAGFLWQVLWFVGPRLLFYGAPWAFNLAPLGWDNRASSAYVA